MMEKLNLTYEQILEKLEEKGEYWDERILNETFGKKYIYPIIDADDMFPMCHGMLVISSLSGFILFPLDEDGDIDQDGVKKMNVDWAKNFENTIVQYENYQKELAQSIDMMKTLVKSQRIKTMFE